MRVLYDGTIFEAQKYGGISRYFVELISGMGPDQAALALSFSDNHYLHAAGGLGVQRNPKVDRARGFGVERLLPGRIRRVLARHFQKEPMNPQALNRKNVVEALKAGHFDIFHPTYYDDYYVPLVGTKPVVVTVYDMIHEIYPEFFHVDDRVRLIKRTMAVEATHVIAISETTKKDLVSVLRIPPEKVSVVPLATSMAGLAAEVAKRILSPKGLPPRFILFTGVRPSYKNFYFFVAAISDLLKESNDLHLVCTGSPFSENELEYLGELGLTQKVVYVFANDEELAALYSLASVFVFPSQYEGFGLPMLEAFACGCPVVACRTPALEEVGGTAALYFSAKNSDELRTQVWKVLNEPELRESMVRAGLVINNKYSWQRVALETKRVYEGVLNGQQQ